MNRGADNCSNWKALYSLFSSPPHFLHSLKVKISFGDFFTVVHGVRRLLCFTLISYIYPICLGKISPSWDPRPSAIPLFLYTLLKLVFIIFHHLLFPWKQRCTYIFSYLTFLHKPGSSPLELYLLLPGNDWEISVATGPWTTKYIFLV